MKAFCPQCESFLLNTQFKVFVSLHILQFKHKNPQTLADHLVKPRNKYPSSFTLHYKDAREQLFKLLKQKPATIRITKIHIICVFMKLKANNRNINIEFFFFFRESCSFFCQQTTTIKRHTEKITCFILFVISVICWVVNKINVCYNKQFSCCSYYFLSFKIFVKNNVPWKWLGTNQGLFCLEKY